MGNEAADAKLYRKQKRKGRQTCKLSLVSMTENSSFFYIESNVMEVSAKKIAVFNIIINTDRKVRN